MTLLKTFVGRYSTLHTIRNFTDRHYKDLLLQSYWNWWAVCMWNNGA